MDEETFSHSILTPFLSLSLYFSPSFYTFDPHQMAQHNFITFGRAASSPFRAGGPVAWQARAIIETRGFSIDEYHSHSRISHKSPIFSTVCINNGRGKWGAPHQEGTRAEKTAKLGVVGHPTPRLQQIHSNWIKILSPQYRLIAEIGIWIVRAVCAVYISKRVDKNTSGCLILIRLVGDGGGSGSMGWVTPLNVAFFCRPPSVPLRQIPPEPWGLMYGHSSRSRRDARGMRRAPTVP